MYLFVPIHFCHQNTNHISQLARSARTTLAASLAAAKADLSSLRAAHTALTQSHAAAQTQLAAAEHELSSVRQEFEAGMRPGAIQCQHQNNNDYSELFPFSITHNLKFSVRESTSFLPSYHLWHKNSSNTWFSVATLVFPPVC